MKEDLFFEEKLSIVPKGLKNKNALCAYSVVNKFLQYGGSEVKEKLLKIMHMIFENGKYLTVLEKPPRQTH